MRYLCGTPFATHDTRTTSAAEPRLREGVSQPPPRPPGRWPVRIISFCLTGLLGTGLLGTGLVATALPAEASKGHSMPTETLWTAGAEGAMVIDSSFVRYPSGFGRNLLPETAGARAVAVDAERSALWVFSEGALSRFHLAGGAAPEGAVEATLEWRQPLDGTGGVAGHLLLTPEDGSLWLARGDRLEAFGTGGQRLHELKLDGAARALGFDAERSLLWAASAQSVTAFDPVGGYELRTLALDEASAPDSMSLDLASGDLWIAIGGSIERFSADGQHLGSFASELTEGSTVLAPGGAEGLWAANGATLQRLGADGAVIASLRPFEDPARIVALTFDAATRSLWVSDGRELVRISASGWELERLPLSESTPSGSALSGEATDLRDLAVLSLRADDEAPVVRIVDPSPGSIVRGSGTRFEVRYEDDRSGVRSGSLKVEVDGRPTEASCTYRVDRAVCQLETAPPRGVVELAVTVADEMGNLSAAALTRFDNQPSGDGSEGEEGDGEDPGRGEEGDFEVKIEGPPEYTPVVTPRGFRTNVPFLSASEIDHIDTASGNLVVTVPLGQTYEVGPSLRYNLQPVYNSNLWEHIEIGCPPTGCPPPLEPITFAMTNYAANAGLGWELHLGRLYAPIPPSGLNSNDWKRWPNRPRDSADINSRWMYVAPSGAVTFLHTLNGRPGWNSKDGSFVRMKDVGTTEKHVEFPNGLVTVFKKTNDLAGTEFCGTGATGCWRFHEKRDPYGNFVRVAYTLSGSVEKWIVSDSTGRQHTVHFSHADSLTAGGDGVSPFRTQDGDEFGDLRKVVTKVELAAFGAQKATYGFVYVNRTLVRGKPHDANQLPVSAHTIRVPVLDRITVPHSQPWRFENSTSSSGHFSGRLTAATGPSRGKIEWVYSNGHWRVPTVCTYHNVDPGLVDWDYQYTGVRQRIAKRPNGTVEGTWTYSSQLYPLTQQLPLFGGNCARANYRVTTVDAPAGTDGKHTRTVFYNSVAQGPRLPSKSTPIDEWQVTDNGLPFAKDFKTGGTTATRRFLSRQTFLCSGSTCGGAKRSVYVRYATDWRTCSKALGESALCYQVNPIKVAEKIIFHDDGNRYIDVENRQFDGAGNFRLTVTTDNFAGSHQRVDRTTYTATGSTALGINSTTGYISVGTPSSYLPSLSTRWILHPYSKKSAQENGRTYTTEFQFNSQGSMTCSRKWKGGARGGKDLVVKLDRGTTAGVNLGLPIRETVAGGEGASLSSSLCSINGSASNGSRYILDHAYQYLQLKSTHIAGYPYRYRATVDRNTGLPTSTYNPSDQRTTHAFDLLGRHTGSTPEASLGEASTQIVYRNPSNGDPSIDTFRKNGSTTLTKETVVYDHFARPIRNILRRPTGNASFVESESKTFYDAAGRVTKITTLQNKASVNTSWATVYSQYDAFDQPGRIVSPDGQVETRIYKGIREVRSTVQVRTSANGTSAVTTTTRMDHRGRIVHLSNPKHTTTFTHDPFDRRVSARRTGGGIPAQTRLYGYDARGILLNERHPELNNGYVTYQPDAFGQRRRIQDAGRNLTLVYDSGARLTQVKNTSGGKVWQSWTWANANSGADRKKGKITQAVRHNYPGGGSDDWAVYETYEYRGKHGKISKKTTQLQFPNAPGADRYGVTFSQTFAYGLLGRPTSYGYPQCVTTSQNGRRQCNDGPNDVVAPNHTVTVTYNQGITRRVSSNLGPWGEYNYHANLQISRLDYSNGVDGLFDQGTKGMMRPQRLRYVKGAATRYDSGTFGYDGAGNIWMVGSDRFVYDQASRLLSGTVNQAGAGRKQEYTYDAAGNITSLRQDGGGIIPYTIQGSTNRMTGGIVYDGAGNMTRVGSPVLYEMDYDALNQQIRFRNNGISQEYLYAFGPGEYRWIAFEGGTGERTFKFRDLEGRVLREYKVNGWGPYVSSSQQGAGWVFQKDFIYGPDGLIATRDRNGTQRFFHKDHVGSPRAITDSGGTRRGWRHFYPFGTAVATSSGDDEPTVKFTGHERDPANLTDYMKARTYLFPFGRFASIDPVRDGWNLYAYVGNNPIRFTDPTGLAQFVIIVGDPGLGHHNQGDNFRRAAETRRAELEAAGDTVTVVEASTVDDFNDAITSGPVIDGGVIYFGHGTWNALYVGEGAETSTANANLDPADAAGLDNTNLGAGCTIQINACFSGNGGSPIAQDIATALGRNVTAPEMDMSFSGPPPTYASTPGSRPPDTGPLYMVANPNGTTRTFTP